MDKIKELTQTWLKEVLHYDENSGEFRWKMDKGSRARAGGVAGNLNKINGYIHIRLDGKLYKAHRLAWLYVHGKFPDNHTDHQNRCKIDNRISNLRDVTNAENQRNRSLNKNSTSGVTGVSWHSPLNKWRANIKIDGKTNHLGYFTNKEDAIKCRQAANIKYGFHKNHGKAIAVA